MTRYFSAEARDADDFGEKFSFKEGEKVYDAATRTGQWATMTEASFKRYGRGLGTGLGQLYIRTADNQLVKKEG